jgi:DNA-binding transcriptional regulator YiaG
MGGSIKLKLSSMEQPMSNRNKDYPNTKLRDIIQAKGLTGTRVAYDLGVSQAHLSKWGLGWAIPPDPMKKKIAEYLGIEISDVWKA